MANHLIQAAWHYHNGTKHPDGYLMDRWHSFDPMNHPLLFKKYLDADPIPLPLNPSPSEVPALSAISTKSVLPVKVQIPDLEVLARILYFSAGITKRINYPWGEMPFRAAACTGALYHIELYLVCGDLPGLKAGVYHFDPGDLALRQLRQGDYRGTVVDASGDQPNVAAAPAIIIYTDVFWRNACKYQAREYRHAFWDCGTILANTLAISSAHGMTAQVIVGFVDDPINRLLDLDTQREVSLVLLPLGHAPGTVAVSRFDSDPISLETIPISESEIEFPAIWDMHEASSLATKEEVISWRGEAVALETPHQSRHLVPLDTYSTDEMSSDPIDSVIVRRGSSRRFALESITFSELSTVLERSTQGIPADFLGHSGSTLNDIYLIVNAVDGLASGAYVFHRDLQALELLREGDLRQQAGYLGLHQMLPADASVDIFFLSDFGPILERFGNRGYRAAQLDASITAGKIYLAAYALMLGASGLTFYDDGVTDFFSPHAQGKSVMFMLALGKRAKRRLVNIHTNRLRSKPSQ